MKRIFRGKVISKKTEKTAVVSVEKKKNHPIYRKKYLYSKNFMADDQVNVEKGDYVIIEETKPISKNKKWKVIKKITEKEVNE